MQLQEKRMRDRGLNEAISAVGGVSELARQLGISQPSVSNWTRVPAERVVAVEAITGVDRAVLRPDLYGGDQVPGAVDEFGTARAREYTLLAVLLARAPDAAMLEQLSGLRDGDGKRAVRVFGSGACGSGAADCLQSPGARYGFQD